MINKDGTDLMCDCYCGCDNGMRIRIDKEDDEYYCFLSYTIGKWYSEQQHTVWDVIRRKIKRVWCILRNKDYHYSEIHMTKEDFEEFRKYINSL